jgi:hypothetical protein
MDYIPTPAARVLGAKPGEGARCRIDRDVIKGLPVYVTVFAPRPDHTRYLLDAHRNEQWVTLIVRVLVRPEDGDWKGFLLFEKRSIARPWVLVVEDIV